MSSESTKPPGRTDRGWAHPEAGYMEKRSDAMEKTAVNPECQETGGKGVLRNKAVPLKLY